MTVWKHQLVKPSVIVWKELKRVEKDGNKTVVEIERQKEVDSIFCEWLSDSEDGEKSNPYPDVQGHKIISSIASEMDAATFAEQKIRSTWRSKKLEAIAKLEELKARQTWTIAQAREAILSIAKLLE